MLIALSLSPTPARGQSYTFLAGLLVGAGGALDEGGVSSDHSSLALNFSMVTEPRTLVGIRYGELDFGSNEVIGNLTNASLSYLNVAGEYRFPEGYFESGIYLGLGAYRIEGNPLGTGDSDDSTLGLVLGFTGEFQMTRSFSVLVDLALHYADLRAASTFVTAQAGVGYRF